MSCLYSLVYRRYLYIFLRNSSKFTVIPTGSWVLPSTVNGRKMGQQRGTYFDKLRLGHPILQTACASVLLSSFYRYWGEKCSDLMVHSVLCFVGMLRRAAEKNNFKTELAHDVCLLIVGSVIFVMRGHMHQCSWRAVTTCGSTSVILLEKFTCSQLQKPIQEVGMVPRSCTSAAVCTHVRAETAGKRV